MTRNEVYSNFRRMIGNPETTEVSDRDTDEYLASAADFLASELKDLFTTETQMLALTAGEQELPLPPDLGWVLFVEWNATRLTPSSHFQWDREGTAYRTATSGNPAEFAVYDRKLILMPPPSAAAITTDGNLTIRYIGTAKSLTATGMPGFGNFEVRLWLWEAAYEYLVLHPSDVNQARAQACLGQVQRLLPAAQERARRPIEDQAPQWWPRTRRLGGAR